MKAKIIAVLLSTLVCGAALADEAILAASDEVPAYQPSGDVAVFPVNGTNIGTGESDAIGALFARAYANASGLQVLSAAATRSIVESSRDAPSAAQALGVREYIVIDAIRLTTKVQLSAARFDANGMELHRAEMTALSLDDVETVADRLAVALYHKQSTRETRTIDNIGEGEGKEPNRLFSEKVFGFKLQVSAIVASGAKYDPAISALFDVRFEGESYFLEVGIGLMIPTNAWQGTGQVIRNYGGVISELGASYYFLNGDISLYAGGGVLPRLVGSDNTGFGVRLAVYAQGGVMFFRQSSVRLYTDFRVAQNVIPFQSGAGGAQFFPTELTLSFGFGW